MRRGGQHGRVCGEQRHVTARRAARRRARQRGADRCGPPDERELADAQRRDRIDEAARAERGDGRATATPCNGDGACGASVPMIAVSSGGRHAASLPTAICESSS